MKNLLILLIFLALAGSGCEKPAKNTENITKGVYYGTFQRNNAGNRGLVSNISISFFDGKWIGESDMQHYPAICHGTYETKGNKLIIANECAWTADFDWSLIFSGEYIYIKNGDSLIITKTLNNSTGNASFDIYKVSLPKSGIKQSPMTGTWVESYSKTDTIVFSPEYDGQFPVFNLKRAFRITEGYKLPGYFSGPYWYIPGEESLSINWFLSSNSAFNRYYFKLMPEGNQFKIAAFFTDTPEIPEQDTLTFVRIQD
jgi:hypothetical protein